MFFFHIHLHKIVSCKYFMHMTQSIVWYFERILLLRLRRWADQRSNHQVITSHWQIHLLLAFAYFNFPPHSSFFLHSFSSASCSSHHQSFTSFTLVKFREYLEIEQFNEILCSSRRWQWSDLSILHAIILSREVAKVSNYRPRQIFVQNP